MRNVIILFMALSVSSGLAGVGAVLPNWKSKMNSQLANGHYKLMDGVRKTNSPSKKQRSLEKAARAYEKAFDRSMQLLDYGPFPSTRQTLVGFLILAKNGLALARRSLRDSVPDSEGGPRPLAETLNW